MMANTFISKEQFCRDYHVGKATALWLIQTGLLSAIDTGRKTGRYLIADTDIQTFVYTSTYLRTQHFKLVLRRHNLREIRFHDLRHSCASLLLKNGAPMKNIQEWLGHSSFSTTANLYAHLETQSKSNSASLMTASLSIQPGISPYV